MIITPPEFNEECEPLDYRVTSQYGKTDYFEKLEDAYRFFSTFVFDDDIVLEALEDPGDDEYNEDDNDRYVLVARWTKAGWTDWGIEWLN